MYSIHISPESSPSSSSSSREEEQEDLSSQEEEEEPGFELKSISADHSEILHHPLWKYSPFLRCVVKGGEYRLDTKFSPELILFMKDYLVWYHDLDPAAKLSKTSSSQPVLRSISIEHEFSDPFEQRIASRLEQNQKLLEDVRELSLYFSIGPLVNLVTRLCALLETRSQYIACRLRRTDPSSSREKEGNWIYVATPDMRCTAALKGPQRKNIEYQRRSKRWLATAHHPYSGGKKNGRCTSSVPSSKEEEGRKRKALKGKGRRIGRSIYAGG